jgi:hypothetical protein
MGRLERMDFNDIVWDELNQLKRERPRPKIMLLYL